MLSIIIPAYNEEKSIKETLEKVLEVGNSSFKAFEVIVVNDGSADKTLQMAEEVHSPNIKILNRGYNKGYGASLKEGINYAKGDVIAITDADGTYPIEDLPKIVEPVEAGYSMCVGARRGRYKNSFILKAFPKFVLDTVANMVAGQKIPDINSGFRAFRKADVLRFFNIISDKFSFTTTITLSYLCNGLSVLYVPIEYKQRKGESKVKPKDALEFMSLILRTVTYFNPLRIFGPVAFFLMSMGILKFIYDVVSEPYLNVTDSSVFLFLTGFQILAIGLMADLIKSTRT